MDDYESLSHATSTCKYHVVFIPNCRSKALYLELRRHLGELFRKLALQKEGRGRASDARPRVHAVVDSAEVRGIAGGRVTSRARARATWPGSYGEAQAQLRGLGARVLREH